MNLSLSLDFNQLWKKALSKLPLFFLSETIIYLFLSPLILTAKPLNNIVFFLLITLVNIGFLKLLFLIHKIKGKKSLYYCLLYFIAAILIFSATKMHINNMSFLDWILSGAGFDFMYINFMVIISLVSIFFVTTTVFYFTQVYFRGLILIFLMFIPLCYSYVLVKELSLGEILFLSLSLIIIIIQGLEKKLSSEPLIINKAFFKLISIAVSFICVVTIAMPKTLSTPYTKVLDNIISYNPFESKGINQLGSINNYSGASNYRNINSSRLLYTVEANETLYLKKISFLEYIDNQWFIPYNRPENNINIKQYIHNTSVAEFYNFLRDSYPDKKEIFEQYNIKLSDIPKTKIKKRNAKIKTEKFRATYAISPLKNITTKVGNSALAQNVLGVIYLPYIDSTMEYEVDYYSDDLKYENDIISFSNKFTFEDYYWFINSIVYDDEIGYSEVYDHLFELKQATLFNKANSYISPRIKQLAEEITKGLTSDYDKAVALEDYFRNNAYIYSLDYEPEDKSIEYFIFNSKTGSCGQYATAMTLMAQSVGLCARYTEGFVTTPVLDEKNKYTITGNDAHAYVEVYIPGYGFSVFDPTVASSNEEGSNNDSNTAIAKLGNTIKGFAPLILILSIILFIAFYVFVYRIKPKALDWLFMIKLKKTNSKASFAYKYIRKLLMKKNKAEFFALTPKETAIFVNEKYKLDIDFLVNAFEKELYANDKPDADNVFDIKIKELLNAIRKIK